MAERSFTPEEANDALREIRPLVERMVESRRNLERARERQEALESRIASNGGGIPPHKLAEAAEEIERRAGELAGLVQAIHDRGAIVKDIDSGLVDFLSERDGEQVLLCWRLGEDEITHWHSLEGGYGGRQPL